MPSSAEWISFIALALAVFALGWGAKGASVRKKIIKSAIQKEKDDAKILRLSRDDLVKRMLRTSVRS